MRRKGKSRKTIDNCKTSKLRMMELKLFCPLYIYIDYPKLSINQSVQIKKKTKTGGLDN